MRFVASFLIGSAKVARVTVGVPEGYGLIGPGLREGCSKYRPVERDCTLPEPSVELLWYTVGKGLRGGSIDAERSVDFKIEEIFGSCPLARCTASLGSNDVKPVSYFRLVI